MMRVLLVDDHPLFRQALAATVGQIGVDARIEQCDTLAALRARLATDPVAALVLLDLTLPDSAGIGGLLAIKAHYPQLPVAIVSAIDDAETVATAQACGAAGFISKAAGIEALSAAVRALIGGETWFPEADPDEARNGLTHTQARILDGVHRGLMNKQIAYELGLSEATVKYHLTGLFRKMGVQTRAQLLALARDRSG
jgi:DNA-binding NarL/FixJ family response regulator